jgi:hypothetical protein
MYFWTAVAPKPFTYRLVPVFPAFSSENREMPGTSPERVLDDVRTTPEGIVVNIVFREHNVYCLGMRRVCSCIGFAIVRMLFGQCSELFGCYPKKPEQHPNEVKSNPGAIRNRIRTMVIGSGPAQTQKRVANHWVIVPQT